ncbi:MAG TPA: UDP-N-acetylglucosamine 2-epimerase (non-hydrolyzing) [Acidobacteriota bacterium]|nr:UDP-N-acetylglucosamine 2-epimerase (non-hydrolyzing) [Acidobacteriota bacterium]
MKVLSVVGARPQFIKAAVLSRVLSRSHHEVLLHTGQHYDDCMSGQFLRELALPTPDYELGVGSGTHAQQTAKMLVGIEEAIVREQPDAMVVFGDTNSTLAGALAAAKVGIKIAHVEAGLRSFNRSMPEEVNRVLVDHLSTWLFCPSDSSAKNLETEGIFQGIHVVGDLMAEAIESVDAAFSSAVFERLDLQPQQYLLATIHRAENTDDHERLKLLLVALASIEETVVLPIHPRTKQAIGGTGLAELSGIQFIDPVGYADMVALERSARMILTDSGGVQKEAYWLGVPCLTLREETEWTETVEAGWNVLTGVDAQRILKTVRMFEPPSERPALYSEGRASDRIVALLESNGC